MNLSSSPHTGHRLHNDAPTLTQLCERLEFFSHVRESELRADSIYGPLRLKTEPALIGIRSRRAQHRQNAALYVYRSLCQTAEVRAGILNLRGGARVEFVEHLKGAWPAGHVTRSGAKPSNIPITGRTVFELEAEINRRTDAYKPAEPMQPVPLQEKEIFSALVKLHTKIQLNGLHRLGSQLLDQDYSPPVGRWEPADAVVVPVSRFTDSGLGVTKVHMPRRDRLASSPPVLPSLRAEERDYTRDHYG